MIFNCIKCDFCEEEVHKFESYTSYKWTVDAEGNPVVEANGTCTVCGEKATDILVPEKETITEPKCETAGSAKYSVKVNGIETSKTFEVPATGHNIVTHDATPATCVEEGWQQAGTKNLEKGQVRKYGQCSACEQYFRVVLDEATGEIVQKAEVEEDEARLPIDTENGHDYKLTVNWVELKDAQGNVIGYDRVATHTATLECTREGCFESNSVWNNSGNYYKKVNLKACVGGFLDIKVEGKCTDENGTTVKYTATVELDNGETYAETKTVSIKGHVASEVYGHTSKKDTATGKDIQQHTVECMYCGEILKTEDCTATELTNGPITSAGHMVKCVCGYEFPEPVAHTYVHKDGVQYANENGYMHKLNGANVCSLCGYVEIPSDHKVESSDETGHYCKKCNDAKVEPHTYTEWTRNKNTNGKYTSECTVCGEKTTKGWLEVLASVPEWANNGAGYVTVNYEDGATCTFSDQECDKIVPKGLKLVFKSGSTCTLNTDVTVKGVVEFAEDAKLGGDNQFILDKEVPNSSVTLPKGKTMAEKISSQNDFAVAVKSADVSSVIVDGTDIVLTQELANSVKEKDLTISEGATLKVAENVKYADSKTAEEPTINLEEGSTLLVEGKLGKHVKIEGEGIVELNNSKPSGGSGNGWNLEAAAADGAKNVQLGSDAKIYMSVRVKNELNITAKEGAKITTSGRTNNIRVEKNGQLTIDGVDIEQTATTGTDDNLIQVDEGKLTLKNNTVNVASGYGIVLFGNTKPELVLEGVTVKCTNSSCIGTNNGETKDCKIEVSKSKLEVTGTGIPAVFLPAKGEATFTDCEIKGGSAIEALGLTTLNLKGETKLIATAESYTAPSQTTGAEGSGSPLLIVSRNGYSNSQTMTIKVGEKVTFEATASGGNIGDIEVVNKDANQGINKVDIKYSCERVKISGHQSGNGLEVTSQKLDESALWAE